jgi:tricorn protease
MNFNVNGESRLLRFPTIYNNQIVFSSGGDLYTVSADGGIARKLTNSKGYEMFPRFSPDGKYIAFTGQYDGNTEVYLIPSEGGIPKRLTYTAVLSRDDISDRMGPNNIVMTWTPDGKNITYRSRDESFNDFKGMLFNVPINGGLSTEIPLSVAGFCSYSPDGKELAFNQVFREFRTWKYYRGGMADDIWIYNFETKKNENITNNPSQDIIPMWIGHEIYFLSDRDRTMNIFVYNLDTKQTTKVTNFDLYDVKFPSADGHTIVFENGGYIYKLDAKTKTSIKVPITIEDDDLWARNEFKDASKNINTFDISPNGERLVFGARGEIFSVPADKGITRNLTNTPGVHERNVAWSPDGQYIAYISDATGEFEIYMQIQDGSEPAIQLTTNANTYKFDIVWSPDSKKILWSDRLLRLQYIDVKTKEVKLVTTSKYNTIDNYNWSPDSKWIVFDQEAANRFNVISVYNIETSKINDITSSWFESDKPLFSNDGKYITFISSRDFNPTYSQTEWNHAYINMEKVYMVCLRKDVPSPFALVNDEVSVEEPKKPETDVKKKEEKSTKTEPVKVDIDFDNIEERIISLPVRPSNYLYAACVGNSVYYTERSNTEGIINKMYDLKKHEETELGRNMQMAISSNYKKMVVHEGERWSVIDLPTSKIAMKDIVDLSNMRVWVDYSLEWKQIYDEAWRQMRDFFYVSNMNGLNWKAIHDKYAPLVPYVRQRDDLTYIIGEMIGELSNSHTYVNAGEKPRIEKIPVGLLGAKLSKDASGYFKIDKILDGANWSNNLRSPLTAIGLNIKQGDYILAIDGNSLKQVDDIFKLLLFKADKEVQLTINDKPEITGSRKIIVTTLHDESQLYYYNWVQNNIKKVSEATNGEVGYIHIPDMENDGLNEFAKYFYPQLNKKVLIIDDRGNGGGNVSPQIIERLQRKLTRSEFMRNSNEPNPVPTEMMMGPKIMLIDQYSASDGDLFPYAFKKNKLGLLVGHRTWGGVIGIGGSLPFIDGTSLRKPEFATYSADSSKWIVEGHGVDPDIEVDNDPSREYMGIDDQLNKAIEVAKDELKNYKPLPPIPAAPDKTK